MKVTKSSEPRKKVNRYHISVLCCQRVKFITLSILGSSLAAQNSEWWQHLELERPFFIKSSTIFHSKDFLWGLKLFGLQMSHTEVGINTHFLYWAKYFKGSYNSLRYSAIWWSFTFYLNTDLCIHTVVREQDKRELIVQILYMTPTRSQNSFLVEEINGEPGMSSRWLYTWYSTQWMKNGIVSLWQIRWAMGTQSCKSFHLMNSVN